MAYIYEYIRTRGTKPLHFEQHYERLEELSRSILMLPLPISQEELRKSIVARLKQEGYTSSATNAVCVRINPQSSTPEIIIEEIMYDCFALRAIRPQGYAFGMRGEVILQNTSVRQALLEFNRTLSQINDEGVAVWINEQEEVVAIDGASVIAVFEDEIRFSTRGSGVEAELAYKALSDATDNVTRGSIFVADLAKAKEVLGIDHRGIVALEKFGERRYMDITAEKIAACVDEAER